MLFGKPVLLTMPLTAGMFNIFLII
jgi:hypothetical protein